MNRRARLLATPILCARARCEEQVLSGLKVLMASAVHPYLRPRRVVVGADARGQAPTELGERVELIAAAHFGILARDGTPRGVCRLITAYLVTCQRFH